MWFQNLWDRRIISGQCHQKRRPHPSPFKRLYEVARSRLGLVWWIEGRTPFSTQRRPTATLFMQKQSLLCTACKKKALPTSCRKVLLIIMTLAFYPFLGNWTSRINPEKSVKQKITRQLEVSFSVVFFCCNISISVHIQYFEIISIRNEIKII